ncbi:MAG: polysaccharide pyruvyl transferase family protein [Polyangiaceae bacterium]|nr:polysaccharide pyruvyl transferase family protein [Polyangiaceae bacterium]
MKPIALLTNVSLQNKGDALMAQALIQRLEADYELAFPLSAAMYSRRHLLTYFVALMSDVPAATLKRRVFNSSIGALRAFAAAMPAPWRKRAGCIVEEDAAVILDVSGYCYGDHWGEQRIREACATYKRWAMQGKAIVLMPKTWGPFKTIDTRYLNAMFQWITVAFARDERSLATVRDLLEPEHRAKLHFAPDYTHEVEPVPSSHRTDDAFLIIPSSRMIESGVLSREGYASFIHGARRVLTAADSRVCLLLHETAGDMSFLRTAPELGFANADVIVVQDPREVKGLIARSQGVVTSRLHGLYNSLNSGVPVLVAAWTFKYSEALRQYGCDQCLLDSNDLAGSLQRKVTLLTDPVQREAIKSRMIEGKHQARSATQDMWRLIGESARLSWAQPIQ